jgi:hypothetical protein
MTSTRGGGSEREMSNDELLLALFGIGAVVLAFSKASSLWAGATAWLLEHQVLVSENVTVSVPGAAGAGLDAPRLAIAAAAILILVVGAITAIKARLRAAHRTTRP